MLGATRPRKASRDSIPLICASSCPAPTSFPGQLHKPQRPQLNRVSNDARRTYLTGWAPPRRRRWTLMGGHRRSTRKTQQIQRRADSPKGARWTPGSRAAGTNGYGETRTSKADAGGKEQERRTTTSGECRGTRARRRPHQRWRRQRARGARSIAVLASVSMWGMGESGLQVPRAGILSTTVARRCTPNPAVLPSNPEPPTRRISPQPSALLPSAP